MRMLALYLNHGNDGGAKRPTNDQQSQTHISGVVHTIDLPNINDASIFSCVEFGCCRTTVTGFSRTRTDL